MNRIEALDEFLRELKAGNTVYIETSDHYYRIEGSVLVVCRVRCDESYHRSVVEFNDLLDRLIEGFEVVDRPNAVTLPQTEVRHVRRVEL